MRGIEDDLRQRGQRIGLTGFAGVLVVVGDQMAGLASGVVRWVAGWG